MKTINDIIKQIDFDNNKLIKVNNNLLLTQNQINILKQNKIEYENCNSIRDLMIIIDEILIYEDNTELDILEEDLQERSYYELTNK